MNNTTIDWLARLNEELRQIVIRINEQRFAGAFSNLRDMFNEDIPTSRVTIEVKDLLASLAMTDPMILKNHAHLQNGAVRRIMSVRTRIQQEDLSGRDTTEENTIETVPEPTTRILPDAADNRIARPRKQRRSLPT